jgi:hypothetical protein
MNATSKRSVLPKMIGSRRLREDRKHHEPLECGKEVEERDSAMD